MNAGGELTKTWQLSPPQAAEGQHLSFQLGFTFYVFSRNSENFITVLCPRSSKVIRKIPASQAMPSVSINARRSHQTSAGTDARGISVRFRWGRDHAGGKQRVWRERGGHRPRRHENEVGGRPREQTPPALRDAREVGRPVTEASVLRRRRRGGRGEDGRP